MDESTVDLPEFVLTLVVDDYVITTQYSRQNLHRTLRLAWELLGGIPQAELCIRRHGSHIAYLHTNFRGELDEAEVYARHRSHTNVTPLNPHGPIFAGVFA